MWRAVCIVCTTTVGAKAGAPRALLLRQMAGIFLRGQLCQFVRVQNFFGEALAAFLVKRGNAAFVDDVSSDHFCDVNVKKAGLARFFAVAGTSGFIQPECFVQGAHGEFEVFFVYAHGDFDFRGANDVDVDAFFGKCLEHGASDGRV